MSMSGPGNRLFDPASKNALAAQALIDAGAIPYVKGNIPISLMTIVSPNDIFGRARNPWNVAFTSGGSSEGERALVACRTAPLGLGTDLGGSIRQPCALNLLFGFKPHPNAFVFERCDFTFGRTQVMKSFLLKCPSLSSLRGLFSASSLPKGGCATSNLGLVVKEYAPLDQASKIPNLWRPAIAAVLELLGEKRQAHLA